MKERGGVDELDGRRDPRDSVVAEPYVLGQEKAERGASALGGPREHEPARRAARQALGAHGAIEQRVHVREKRLSGGEGCGVHR